MPLNLSRFALLFTLAPTAWLTALDLRYVILYCLFLVVFLLALSPRPLTRSLPNLPRRWKMGCNRNVRLLLPALFRGLEGGSKGSLMLRIQLRKMQHGGTEVAYTVSQKKPLDV